MTGAGRRALAVVVTAVALWGMARGSEVPYAAGRGHTAELRLSWRLRGEPGQVCRRRTPEELARLPAHMREDEVCERRAPAYRLRVMVADTVREDRLITSGGARADRPLYVFSRFPLAAGTYPVRVEFVREGAGASDTAPSHASPTDAPTPVPARQAPRRLALDTTLTFAESRVLVVIFDDERQLLRVVGGT